MDRCCSFFGGAKFYAQHQFPYGIGRSGEFTVLQTALLENNGNAYEELHNGIRKPGTAEELQFVAVCRGERQPTTDHEQVWVRFCDKTSGERAVYSIGPSEDESSNNHPSYDDW